MTNVSLSINEGDFIGIIGSNRGGKTTLVRVILGLLKPLKGSIYYSFDRSDIGYLPQGNQVDEKFPITVREVVASGLERGLRIRKRNRSMEKQIIDSMLEKVGLILLSSRSIGELSGGRFNEHCWPGL